MPEYKCSIKKQYALIFGILIAGIICILCIVNALILSRFYLHHKQKMIASAYNKINSYAREDTLSSDDFKKTFRRTASMNNLDIIILNSDMDVVIATTQDPSRLSERLIEYIFKGPETVDVLAENSGYQIIRTKDSMMNMEFIELWGMLANGDAISMRSPVESIRESAQIANRLMITVGLIGILIGIIVMFVASGKLTKPIMELVNISERMTHLDFQAKYEGGCNNEIDLLGIHINQLSGALERTITDLQSANAQLQKDIDLKTQIEERRKEFVANVSHELKTPIALIQGYSEGLKDCVNDDAESRDYYCDVIIDEASKMNKMVKNLLELDKIESGINDGEIVDFDINELIANCVASMDILCKQEGIKVTFPEGEIMKVRADEFKIEQILNNYLSNAIHYASGEKIINITCQKEDDNVRVGVFNTGEQIPEEYIDRLWTKFYKVDKARTRTYGGSGIGLSIVKAIMDSMGKDYGVTNREDGVEFWFEVEAVEDV